MMRALTPAEKESLLDQKAELEDTLKQIQQFGVGTAASQIDVTSIERQIKWLEATMDYGALPEIKGKHKDDLIKEADQIEEILKVDMPCREEMRHPARYPGAVRKHLNWNKKNHGRIERYRQIQRLINPEAPKSVEELRRDK